MLRLNSAARVSGECSLSKEQQQTEAALRATGVSTNDVSHWRETLAGCYGDGLVDAGGCCCCCCCFIFLLLLSSFFVESSGPPSTGREPRWFASSSGNLEV